MSSSKFLPEILLLIGAYLSQERLVICLRVCKKWKQAFEHLIWKTIMYHDSMNPGYIDLQSNCHLVKNLKIYNPNFGGDFLDVRFPSLSSLYFSELSNDSALDFILAQESMELLHLSLEKELRSLPATFWQRLSGFKNLQRLHFNNLFLDYASESEASMFWNAFVHTKELTFHSTDFFNSRTEASKVACVALQPMSFPSLQTLEFKGFNAPDNGLLGTLLQRCPNLRTLRWGLNSPRHISIFQELLRITKTHQFTSQNLETLHLRDFNLEDKGLSIILNAMVNIKDLSIESGFGPQSLDALRPHFATVQRLYLVSSSEDFLSSTLQEIMSSCPLLEELQGYKFFLKDIIQAPWICTKLRQLKVPLELGDSGSNDMNARVLDQISQLTELEYLQVGMQNGYNAKYVQLTLEDGLEKLSTLKCLREVEVTDGSMDLGHAEVDWIVAHWKKLEGFHGSMHSDPFTDYNLKLRLKNELCNFKSEEEYYEDYYE